MENDFTFTGGHPGLRVEGVLRLERHPRLHRRHTAGHHRQGPLHWIRQRIDVEVGPVARAICLIPDFLKILSLANLRKIGHSL